jgi:putative NADPH-quinone reductase
MKKIFIISAYPNQDGVGTQLVDNYLEESLKVGHEAILLNLSAISFDPVLHHGYKKRQELEADLLSAQKNISWADHLVFFFPIWWGGTPAILKGFFDRVFLPGFAFNYGSGYLPKQLLTKKSARIIVTMDAPLIFDSLVLGCAGIKLVKKAILQFCGINPVKITRIGRLRYLNEKQKNKVTEKIRQIAKRAD